MFVPYPTCTSHPIITIMLSEQSTDPSLHLPRLLCFHGGGTNARIFHAQCRVLRAGLQGFFRLCFVEAPFPCQPGLDVTSVYSARGPYRRWLRFKREHPEIDAESAVRAIDLAIQATVQEDNQKGATGEWVGLLGFSQGAKLCASLLFRQQVQESKLGKSSTPTQFRFAVLLAGRGPLVSLSPNLVMTPSLVDASHLGFQVRVDRTSREHVLRLPTVHVHGMQDEGLPLHQQMLEQHFEKGRTRLVQWNGGHRVPVETKVVVAIVKEIVAVAKETGVTW
ncbi:hypothetical protein BO71DRAFT_443767 [Aspergillus ellipticus CBS 707.79]|uniref:Serine hydrolase domain-containing protein n=1 Tax=Aspergillus ellipticus CBS 707.79 TaxID=1448320 RepID=A0A319CZZ9_9EURO|nr:hypothetical protein BO71DRAFT_443767 [Aspergillus ellipticus CBS 707.79]